MPKVQNPKPNAKTFMKQTTGKNARHTETARQNNNKK
jgi:hypothetical protein